MGETHLAGRSRQTVDGTSVAGAARPDTADRAADHNPRAVARRPAGEGSGPESLTAGGNSQPVEEAGGGSLGEEGSRSLDRGGRRGSQT